MIWASVVILAINFAWCGFITMVLLRALRTRDVLVARLVHRMGVQRGLRLPSPDEHIPDDDGPGYVDLRPATLKRKRAEAAEREMFEELSHE